jgi:DNA processing protein
MDEFIVKINASDPGFPKGLTGIPQAPKAVYIRGAFAENDIRVAVVGTRICSPYGIQATEEIVRGLAKSGVVIVSGLTPGIDTLAHRAALENNAKTIAVLGTGLDKKSIYPQTNVVLAETIIEKGGALISEYAPGMHGARYTFPQRNRIISGLSVATIVIEAKEKSGSLITANWAKKQGKKVFAIPGSIYSSNSRGCHYLIKNGAILVENAAEILEHLGIGHSLQTALFEVKGDTPEETRILQALSEEAMEVDRIIIATSLPAQKVLSVLPLLEMKEKIKEIGNNIYALNNR